jgi:hypothetical protein
MTENPERICQNCGTINYGVLHHCLKCSAQLPAPDEDAQTMADLAESRFEAPTIIEPSPEPDAFLEVISGEDRGHQYELFDGIRFGRSKDCDIVIDSPKASREHALIVHNEYHQWLLSDLQSTNGTLLNNKKVIKPTALYNGDEILIEGFEFKVTIKKPFHTPVPAKEQGPLSPDFSKKSQESGKGGKRNTFIIVIAGVILLACLCAAVYFGWSWLSNNYFI